MKSLLTYLMTLILLFAMTAKINAQDDYVMFLGLYLDPIPGKAVDLVKGVKEHNAKFHTEGDSKAYLWSILTGPRSGQYTWAQGPMKYAKLDEGLTDEHNADWAQKVMSHCRNNEDIRIFRRMEEHTYNPQNEVIGENVLARIWYGVSDRQVLLDGLMKIKEVLVKTNSDYARRIYVTDFQNKEREDVMLIYPFDSWTVMETRRGLGPDFAETFDEINGEGSWEELTAALSEAADGFYDEVRVMVK